MHRGLVSLMMAVALIASSAAATTVSGTVLDPSGAVVAGTAVSLVSGDSDVRQDSTTAAQGDFSFTAVPAGRYQLEVRCPGFMLHRQAIAVTNTGQTIRVYPILRVGAVFESMEIRAAVQPRALEPRRVRVGGNVQPVRLVRQVRPVYPEGAKTRGITGTVLLRSVIRIDGALSEPVVLLAPDPELAASALETVKQWQYQPALLNGQPVEVETVISLSYHPQ